MMYKCKMWEKIITLYTVLLKAIQFLTNDLVVDTRLLFSIEPIDYLTISGKKKNDSLENFKIKAKQFVFRGNELQKKVSL